MSLFPETSATLLAKLAAQTAGENEAAWLRFFELYSPAIAKYAELQGTRDADDVVQEVLLRLVDVFREGRFQPGDIPFRAYLVTVIKRIVISLYRKDQVRGGGRTVELTDEMVAVPPDAVARLEAAWKLATRQAAIEHVLTKTAVSAQSKDVYRAYALEERPIVEVAKRFGISRNSVSQIKTRLDRLVAAVEQEMVSCE